MQDNCDESLVELNNSLLILANIFPRILPEVLRELLHTFDGNSGLQIAIEQLLKHQDQWVRGRWRTGSTDDGAKASMPVGSQQLITASDQFRRPSYKMTAQKMLRREFRTLSRSKIEAVLAEENYYYSRARLTLQKLASKNWRNSLSALIAKWRKPADPVLKDHYMLVRLTPQGKGEMTVPVMKATGDPELDLELHEQVLRPILEKEKRERAASDWDVAALINDAEAQNAGAVYECECCYSATAFEQMASCTSGGHVICFRCVWHAVSEALFGQSWGRNIEHDCGQLKCLAPVLDESCEGCIPPDVVRRAMLQSRGGEEALAKLEARLAEESVSKSRLPLVRCPFCAYVEVDELYVAPKILRYRINTAHSKSTFVLLVAMLNYLPLMLFYALISHFPLSHILPYLEHMFSRSLARLSRSRHRPQRFQCRSTTCGARSCMICLKAWYDPHICYESATLSLRTTVEAARTAALKRTCPRCGLGFIKESGCNKLTCVCGYTMCYVCRQGLGRGGGGEGYRHFCQHFRAAGGTCKECDKCDLYKNENDEALVNRAGILAEKEWREKGHTVGVQGVRGGYENATTKIRCGEDWTVQGFLDWWVEKALTC